MTSPSKRLYPCCIHCRNPQPQAGDHHSVPCLKCHPELDEDSN